MVNSIGMIHVRTTNQVRIQGELTEEFTSYKGVRQRCPLSPLLFNQFVGGLGKWIENNQEGGVVMGRYKIFLLAYADDMVIVARPAEELQSMIDHVSKYFIKKKLIMNVEKSKLMVFRKGEEERKMEIGGGNIEKVKTFKYLGYMFQCNNGRKSL